MKHNIITVAAVFSTSVNTARFEPLNTGQRRGPNNEMATTAEMGVVINNSQHAELNIDDFYQQCCEDNIETLWIATTGEIYNEMINKVDNIVVVNRLGTFHQCFHSSPGEALQHFAQEITGPGANIEEQHPNKWKLFSFTPNLQQREWTNTGLRHRSPSEWEVTNTFQLSTVETRSTQVWDVTTAVNETTENNSIAMVIMEWINTFDQPAESPTATTRSCTPTGSPTEAYDPQHG